MSFFVFDFLDVPNLRFPEFTGEWKETIFEKICNIATGNKNTQDKKEDGEYPFYVRSEMVERINSYSFNGEAILTAGDGVGVGKVFHYVNGKVGVHQRVYILSNFECSCKFAYYYFSSKFYNRVKRMSAKNSVDSVRHDMIAQMPILLPARHEQNKIAQFLCLLEQRIETQIKIIEDLKKLKSSLLDLLFQNNSKWSTYCISEILTIGNGRDYKHLKEGNIPVYGTGGYMLSVNDYLYEGESVCIGRKGTIDMPMFLTGKFWTVDTLFYTHNFRNILPKFCYYLFTMINWQRYNEASGVPSLSKATIEKIKVSVPSINEQVYICSILDSVNNKIDVERSILNEFKKQKQHLLQQMFV
ncbi:restriction endonuclease subunit S [Bacteroides ovatus]|uniref:restriction endonuclease subunit S n=1 Tax=Bacteroides ovatus TaxID=28116 RepID=UPI00319D8AD5